MEGGTSATDEERDEIFDSMPFEAEAPAGTIKASYVTPFEPAKLPQRKWFVKGLICRDRVFLLAGPGGVAKSIWILQLAVALAAGRDDICGFPVNQCRVWVWNQEDDKEEMQRRLAAIMKRFNVTFDDIGDRLLMDSGVDNPLLLVRRTDGPSRTLPWRYVDDVVAEVEEKAIDVFFADPLVELHEAVENDNVQMREVMGQFRRIAVQGHCATGVAHHTKKPAKGSSDGHAGEMDAARGASSQLGVVRIGATIFTAAEKDLKKWKFPAGASHLDWVRLDIAKNNIAAPRHEPVWFERDGVDIAGESIGVLVPTPLEKVVKDEGPTIAEPIAAAIAEHLERDKWHSLDDIISHLTPEDAARLDGKDGKARVRRTRDIDKAFDGNDEILTASGKLKKKNPGAPKPVCFLLAAE